MLKNNLKYASSSYLRSAADQPVHWQEWSSKVFDLARQYNRPILLDIGAVWCHWCHVMDRESYENEEIARFLNEHFIPVKVDRDERPDVDRRYQSFVQATTGSGGWPLTCFLTAEGNLIYGGTYFPPDDRMGKPGLKRILEQIRNVYNNEREKVVENARKMLASLKSYEQSNRKSEKLNLGIFESILHETADGFDPIYGGFGSSPKFPASSAVNLVLTAYHNTGEERFLQIAETTLTHMAQGGIYDHICGGFHRYSVDQFWQVPHFEKMTSDNAELLTNYLDIYKISGKKQYLTVIDGILDWYERDMTDQANGGFYAHQDADITLEDDGDYFTWTSREIQVALPADEARLIRLYFGISPEPRDLHTTPDRNVMYTVRRLENVADDIGILVEEAESLYESARNRLLEERYKRPAPFIDKTLYDSYNGMMISAYAQAFKVLNRRNIKDFTLKSLNRIVDTMFDPEKGFAHSLFEGKARIFGLLGDQVWMTQALLDGFEISGDIRYFDAAKRTMEIILNSFYDDENGGFFDRIKETGESAVFDIEYKPVDDIPASSSNAVAVRLLDRLYNLTGVDLYAAAAEKTLEAFAGTAEGRGMYMAAYAHALYFHLKPPPLVIIFGNEGDEQTIKLMKSARKIHYPGMEVYCFADGTKRDGSLPAAIEEKFEIFNDMKGSLAFVCSGTACAPPTGDPDKLTALISDDVIRAKYPG